MSDADRQRLHMLIRPQVSAVFTAFVTAIITAIAPAIIAGLATAITPAGMRDCV